MATVVDGTDIDVVRGRDVVRGDDGKCTEFFAELELDELFLEVVGAERREL